jgi:hypothetical protein
MRKQRYKRDPALAKLRRKVRSSGFFDPEWYLAQNPDVRAAGIDPLAHFCASGDREHRNPGPFFDSEAYFTKWPDVKASGLGSFEHFLIVGRPLGRVPISLCRRMPASSAPDSNWFSAIRRLWPDSEKAKLQFEVEALRREAADLELKYYVLKAAFDRVVRDSESNRTQLAVALADGKDGALTPPIAK